MRLIEAVINRLVPYIPDALPEGMASRDLVRFFTRLLLDHEDIRHIGETGFNTGLSSRTFLAARPDTTVVSFDIGKHLTVRRAKTAIDRRFPGRHELVIGDSTVTLAEYAKSHPGHRFDLVFVDGGHDYDVARADLLNFRAMSHADTIVIVDDLTPWWRWGEGPARMWRESVDTGVITRAQLYKNGCPARDMTGYGSDRIWAIGYYGDAPARTAG